MSSQLYVHTGVVHTTQWRTTEDKVFLAQDRRRSQLIGKTLFDPNLFISVVKAHNFVISLLAPANFRYSGSCAIPDQASPADFNLKPSPPVL